MGITDTINNRICILDLWLHLVWHINDSSDDPIADTKVPHTHTHIVPSAETINFVFLFFCRNWFVRWITGASDVDHDIDLGSDDEDDDDKDKEEKKTIKERLQAIQEVSQTVQNSIGYLASLGESVKK